MTSPIKVGDIVRVTGIGVGVLTETTIYDVEPLNHGTLTDIEAASVMLERAHHRIGELTRERDEWEGEAAAGIVRREAEVARLIEDRDNACAARDAAFAREEAYVIEIHTLRGRLDDALDELGDARRPTFAERAAPAEVAEFAVGDWAQATIDGAPVGVPFLVRAVDIERGWLRYDCRADHPPPPDGGQEGCPKCFADVPMCPKCAVRKDGCCSDCRLQEVRGARARTYTTCTPAGDTTSRAQDLATRSR